MGFFQTVQIPSQRSYQCFSGQLIQASSVLKLKGKVEVVVEVVELTLRIYKLGWCLTKIPCYPQGWCCVTAAVLSPHVGFALSVHHVYAQIVLFPLPHFALCFCNTPSVFLQIDIMIQYNKDPLFFLFLLQYFTE